MLISSISGQTIALDGINEYGNELDVYIIIAYHADDENSPLCFIELESDVPAFIVDGTTMVPLRVLAEGFSYHVDYQEKDKKIIMQDSNDKNKLIFTIGSTTVLKNDLTDTMLQAPVISNGRTFIPLRYVAEFFGKYVTWKIGFGGERLIIWVSSVQLLTEDDVAAENDSDNYYDAAGSNEPMPDYRLKSNGHTHRGIKIGDSFDKILELYGQPHTKSFRDGIIYSVQYRTEAIPYDDPGSVITFYFINGDVDYVDIAGRW